MGQERQRVVWEGLRLLGVESELLERGWERADHDGIAEGGGELEGSEGGRNVVGSDDVVGSQRLVERVYVP